MSKRIWHHPETTADDTTVAWRGPGQLEDTPAFREWLEREFPRGAAEMADGEDAETTRRSFLKLMGASTALAGLGTAACRRPEAYILPYAEAPEWVIPGKATYYASAMPRAAGATPLLVTTFQGRPTKVAPNTKHPDSDGTDSFAQASVLDLYSPNRSREILKDGKRASRSEFESVLANVATTTDANIGFLFGRDDSPTRTRLIGELQSKYPNAKFYSYEALEGEAPAITGPQRRFVADFSKADRVVSLDCDFVALDPVGPTTPFLQRRKPEGANYKKVADKERMNRLYTVESAYSLTGGMSDHRLSVKPSQLLAAAAELARALGVQVPQNNVPVADERLKRWVAEVANDLPSGRSLVLAGSRTPEAVQRIVAAINAQLDALGDDRPARFAETEAAGMSGITELTGDLNAGEIDTLFLFPPSNPVYDAPADLAFRDALKQAKTSIHLGYRKDATAHAATWHVPATHYLESWNDARTANGVYSIVQPMILPLYPDCAGELEMLIALLTDEGTLVTGEKPDGGPSPAYDEVRITFAEFADDSEEAWKNFLRRGFLEDSRYATSNFSPDSSALEEALSLAPKGGELEIVFATDASVYDGRWIDNGWLQEAPDPISKITWDNVALISPKTAKRLGIYDQLIGLETWNATRSPDGEGERMSGQVITLSVEGNTIEAAAQIGFGVADGTVILPLGYGQGFNEHDPLERDPSTAKFVGLVGVNSGFDAYPLRRSGGGYYAKLDARPKTTGARYPLAATQEHHSMYGRALAREISTATLPQAGDFQNQLEHVQKQGMDSHVPENISLYKPHDRQGKNLINDKVHQWGMAIDLSACTGCNACLIACQAENNIPIVGKEQVAKGREMHWIRMDRYFSVQESEDENGNKVADEDNMEMIPQPVACVQCESAPCETVCPVNATVHTEDGLNAMAYNRCIGTRYCANNCPYKARRFNFFDYNKRNPLIENNLYHGPLGEKQVGTAASLQKNPNVSVRMRGVMEKCTYCVQRLQDGKIRQRRILKQESLQKGGSTDVEISHEQLRVPANSVKTACQEACPSESIVFGNLLEPDSELRRIRSENNQPILERNYDLLNYLNTRPRTSYLARVKNPNPAMPGAENVGRATVNMH